jgi:hypothetical protein
VYRDIYLKNKVFKYYHLKPVLHKIKKFMSFKVLQIYAENKQKTFFFVNLSKNDESSGWCQLKVWLNLLCRNWNFYEWVCGIYDQVIWTSIEFSFEILPNLVLKKTILKITHFIPYDSSGFSCVLLFLICDGDCKAFDSLKKKVFYLLFYPRWPYVGLLFFSVESAGLSSCRMESNLFFKINFFFKISLKSPKESLNLRRNHLKSSYKIFLVETVEDIFEFIYAIDWIHAYLIYTEEKTNLLALVDSNRHGRSVHTV